MAYKITVPIYDYAVAFADRYIDKYSRTHDQWTQAARSGTQNIAEGYALPDRPEVAVNLLITLINQANLLIDRLIESLKEKHKKEGGFTEKLYRQRREYRGL